MAGRKKLNPKEITVVQDIKVWRSMHRWLKVKSKAMGMRSASAYIRGLIEREQKKDPTGKGKASVAARAKKGAQKSFPIRMAAAKKRA